jgi:hypothetical protein
MAASTTAIAQLALHHLGVSSVVLVDVDTDPELEAKSLRAYLATARKETLMAYPWACAEKTATLSLIEVDDDETTPEWGYKYRLPEDCLMPRRILWGGIREPGRQQTVDFRIAGDTESTAYDAAVTYDEGEYASVTVGSVTTWYRALRETINDPPASSASDWVATSSHTGVPPAWLYCDITDAQLRYTRNLTDVRFFTVDLDNALAAKLAFYVAPKLTEGPNAQARMAQLYRYLIGEALRNDLNAEQRGPTPPSSFELARA